MLSSVVPCLAISDALSNGSAFGLVAIPADDRALIKDYHAKVGISLQIKGIAQPQEDRDAVT